MGWQGGRVGGACSHAVPVFSAPCVCCLPWCILSQRPCPQPRQWWQVVGCAQCFAFLSQQAKESIEQLVYLCQTDKEDVREAAKQSLMLCGEHSAIPFPTLSPTADGSSGRQGLLEPTSLLAGLCAPALPGLARLVGGLAGWTWQRPWFHSWLHTQSYSRALLCRQGFPLPLCGSHPRTCLG